MNRFVKFRFNNFRSGIEVFGYDSYVFDFTGGFHRKERLIDAVFAVGRRDKAVGFVLIQIDRIAVQRAQAFVQVANSV